MPLLFRQMKTSVLFVPAYAPTQYEMASSRQRVYQYLPRLRELGIKAEVLVPPISGITQQILYRLELLRRARMADVIFIQKKLFHIPYLRLLLKVNPNLVFDLDDALFVQNPGAPELSPHMQVLKQRLDFILSCAQQVIVCNEYLATYARSWNAHVIVLPTVVDTHKFTPPSRRENLERDPVTIGWVGSGEQHLPHLRIVENPLRVVSREFPIQLCLVGTMNSQRIRDLFANAPFPVKYIDWIAPDELPAAMAAFDIGIMPLVDDAWSQGKCAFKALLYMAMGVPTIVSPVGMNCQVIRNQENGVWARDEAEWIEQIRSLVTQPELRVRLSTAGLSTVRNYYSLDVLAPQLAHALHEAANSIPPR